MTVSPALAVLALITIGLITLAVALVRSGGQQCDSLINLTMDPEPDPPRWYLGDRPASIARPTRRERDEQERARQAAYARWLDETYDEPAEETRGVEQ